MKIYGKCERLNGTAFYSVQDPYTHLCGDVCHAVLTNEEYGDNGRLVTWGYDGVGPDLLSCGLLVTVLSDFGFHTLNEHVAFRYFDAQYIHKKEPQREIRERNGALKLYRLFTQQVVSKLPDNWEMTTDEIKAWIKNHKKLPACVRSNHGTKRDKVRRDHQKAG